MQSNPFSLPPKLWKPLTLLGLAVGFLAGELVEARGLDHSVGMRVSLLVGATLIAGALGAWWDKRMTARTPLAAASGRAQIRATALAVVALVAMAALPFGRMGSGVTLLVNPLGAGDVDGRLCWITGAIALACAAGLAANAYAARSQMRRLEAADEPEPAATRPALRRALAASLIGCVPGAVALALVVALPLVGGIAPPRPPPPPEIPPDLRIKSSILRCGQPCYRYSVEVDHRGAVTFNGKEVLKRVSRSRMKILVKEIEEARFFELENSYPRIGRHDSEILIELRMNGREKSIAFHSGFDTGDETRRRLMHLDWLVDSVCESHVLIEEDKGVPFY